MDDEKMVEQIKTEQSLKDSMISRLINWKFDQATQYSGALQNDDSKKCLELLCKIWGDTGWERGSTVFGTIVQFLVEFIIMKEGWTKELCGETED